MKTVFYLLIFIIMMSITTAQTIRPIRDNIGFCWNADEMNSFIKWLDKNTNDQNFSAQNLIAGISVHDDYLYAGKIYHTLFKLIKAKEVVIFGVTHSAVRKEINDPKNVLILDEFDEWKGPYGNVQISPLREIIKSKLEKDYYIVNNQAQSLEHSIEALVPWLQHYNRSVIITPIMVTQIPFERMKELGAKLSQIFMDYINTNKYKLGKDIFFLISNDANHYGEDFNNSPYGLDANAHKAGTENDQRIIKENLVGEITVPGIEKLTHEIWPSGSKKVVPIWCGRYPMVLGLLTINKLVNDLENKKISGALFKYSDAFTEKVLPFKNSSMGLTAVFSYRHWCAWFTEGFYLK